MIVRRSRAAGLFALTSFVCALALPLVAPHHGDDADLGWGEPRLGSGHPVTQFEPIHPPIPSEHCALCHWARSLSSTISGQPVACLPPAQAAAAVVVPSDSVPTAVRTAGSPRGPPAIV